MRYQTTDEVRQEHYLRLQAQRQPIPTTDIARAAEARFVEQDERTREKRAEAVIDLVTSTVWTDTAIPALRALRANLERRLAVSSTLGLEQIRGLQAQWTILDDLIEKPSEVFRSALED